MNDLVNFPSLLSRRILGMISRMTELAYLGICIVRNKQDMRMQANMRIIYFSIAFSVIFAFCTDLNVNLFLSTPCSGTIQCIHYCEIVSFRRGVNEIIVLLGCYAAFVYSQLPTFRDNLSVSSSRDHTSVTSYLSAPSSLLTCLLTYLLHDAESFLRS